MLRYVPTRELDRQIVGDFQAVSGNTLVGTVTSEFSCDPSTYVVRRCS